MTSVDIAVIVEKVLSYGLLGVYAVVVTLAYFRKDEALQTEKNSRISDAKDFNKMAMDLQGRVSDTVNKQADILDEVKRLVQPRGNVR